MNVEQLRRAFPDEESCRAFFESIIWPEGPICPHCQSQYAWRLRSLKVRAGLYRMRRLPSPVHSDYPDPVPQHQAQPVDLDSGDVFNDLL